MDKQTLKNILQKTYPFISHQDLGFFLDISEYRLLANREVIIRAGQNTKLGFFILKGMVRGYFLNRKGEEKNIFLRPEHTFTAAPDSLFLDVPTRYNFESILETHLLVLNMRELEQHMSDRFSFTKFYLAGLEENILTLIGRVEALIDKSPEERYLDLLKRSPQFFQKAFHKHIANYLGITPVSLSRIVKRLQEKGELDN